MFARSTATALVTTVAAAIALPATGQETVGSLSGTLDGVQTAFTILDGAEHETGWESTEDGLMVTLDAYPADGTVSEETRLRMVFVTDPASLNPQMLSGDVTLNRDGEALTAQGEAIELELDSAEVSGDSLYLRGNIAVTLSADEENVSVVAENGVTLSSGLQATVIRAE